MQLRPEALEGHLAKGLAPLYVITSDEHLLALEAADRILRYTGPGRYHHHRRDDHRRYL